MANVSHDLRTPLTIIKSYAEMIRDLSGKDDQKRTLHTNVIVDEADRLSMLVNDILDLSKLESGVSGKVYITLENEAGKIRFSVRDTGNGIAQDELPKVWQRYWRASNTHKRASVGTGIGLSIVKTVLAAHNAQYGVDSKIGEGSTFWFCIESAE